MGVSQSRLKSYVYDWAEYTRGPTTQKAADQPPKFHFPFVHLATIASLGRGPRYSSTAEGQRFRPRGRDCLRSSRWQGGSRRIHWEGFCRHIRCRSPFCFGDLFRRQPTLHCSQVDGGPSVSEGASQFEPFAGLHQIMLLILSKSEIGAEHDL